MQYYDATDIIGAARAVLDGIELKITGSRITRIFWHLARVRWYTPPILFGKTHQLEKPFHRGYCVMLRYSLRHVLVLGVWGNKAYDEESNLLDATIMGRKRTSEERNAFSESLATAATASGVSTASEAFSLGVLDGRPGLRDGATVHAGIDVIE